MSTLLKSALISSIIIAQTLSANAATGSDFLSTEISAINDAITLDAAPTYASAPLIVAGGITYTSWELIHRTPMLSGFQWGGEMAQFITPQMYVGTPFADSREYIGESDALSAFLVKDATNYSECLQNESYLSYGLGERIEKTDIREFKAIAKTCAQQFYGTYFDGTLHTTREEYIMMLMTMFGEDISLSGEFTEDGKYIPMGDGVESGFANVKSTAWYSPYLAYADDLGILSTEETSWAIAREITDAEAISMLLQYTGYKMGYPGTDIVEKGMIQAENLRYNIVLLPEGELEIEVITGTIPANISTEAAISQLGKLAGFEIIAPSIVKKDEPFDITVRAVDADNNTVKNYQSSIIFISDTFGDTIPAPGEAIKFTTEDSGQKKFSNGVVLRSLGKQKIYVADIHDSTDIVGEIEITVVAQ